MKIWAVMKKELRLYFTTPVAYGVMFCFLLIAGYFFYSIFTFYAIASMQVAMNPQGARELNVTDSVMRPLFSNMSVILLLLMPLITMRLFAEERRSGTIELLLTYPVRDGAVLLGKYFAAVVLYAVMLVLTLVYPGIVWYFARPEWGPLLTAYVGLLLMGACFISVGLLISSFTRNQIVAGTITFAVFLLLWVINWVGPLTGPRMSPVLDYLSITSHLDDFTRGVVDTKHVVYYVSFIAFGLFLTARSVDTERWRG